MKKYSIMMVALAGATCLIAGPTYAGVSKTVATDVAPPVTWTCKSEYYPDTDVDRAIGAYCNSHFIKSWISYKSEEGTGHVEDAPAACYDYISQLQRKVQCYVRFRLQWSHHQIIQTGFRR